MSARSWILLAAVATGCSAAPDARPAPEPWAPLSAEIVDAGGTVPDDSDAGVQIGAEGAPPNCVSYVPLDLIPGGALVSGQEILDGIPSGIEGWVEPVDGSPFLLWIDLSAVRAHTLVEWDSCLAVYRVFAAVLVTTRLSDHETSAVIEGPHPDEMQLVTWLDDVALPPDDEVNTLVGDLGPEGGAGDLLPHLDTTGEPIGRWSARAMASQPR